VSRVRTSSKRDCRSVAREARAETGQLSSAENAKPKHFSYFWVREWWKPATAARIVEWGETIWRLAEVVMLAKPPQGRHLVQSCVEALRRLRRRTRSSDWRLSALYPGRGGGRESAVHDVFSQAGVRTSSLEDIALELVRRGWVDLAWQVVAIDEFLSPEGAGPPRYHVMALSGRRESGVAGLERIARNAKQDEFIRAHAAECLAHFRKHVRGGSRGSRPE
jgi:hypothetical protein